MLHARGAPQASDPHTAASTCAVQIGEAEVLRTSGRVRRGGPESELVDAFLRAFPRTASRGERITIFQEPKLTSGLPDLVVVRWHERTARVWRDERRCLKDDDLRLLHLLAQQGPMGLQELRPFTRSSLRCQLDHLVALGLAQQSADRWRTRPLNKVFAVRHIAAFEAKVQDWATAIEQACLNRWFASESYVVLPRLPRRAEALDVALEHGVGLWIAGEPTPALAARQGTPQPVSYASWLFNEWAWRAANANEGGALDASGVARSQFA